MPINSHRDLTEMPLPPAGRAKRPLRVVLPLVLVFVALAGEATAQTASPTPPSSGITVEPRALMGGNFDPGGWLALQVSVTNRGTPVDGYVSAISEGGEVRRFVELPAGARKSVPLYVQPQAFARQIRVRFTGTDGAALAEGSVEVRAMDRGGAFVAVVADDASSLRGQLLADQEADVVGGVLALRAADLPGRAEPLSGFAAMVWAADTSTLEEEQRRAVDRFVADGGQLVVIGGADWQARTAGFEDMLPVSALRAVDSVTVATLAEWAGSDPPAATAGTVSVGELKDDGRTLVPFGADAGEMAGQPLIAARTHGAGRVIFVAADLSVDAFADWEGAASLWARLIPGDRALEAWLSPSGPNEAAFAFIGALGSIAALDVPAAEILLLVIVGYIILIGPVTYLVLRRMDRRDLAWITAPALVVVFSACSYGIGSATKGSDIILNEISVVRTAGAGTAAAVETWAGLFSPTQASYDLSVNADALVAPLAGLNEFDQQGRPVTPEASVEQGDPARLRGLDVNVYGFEAVRADAIVDYTPSLEVTWHHTGDGIAGSVTNAGDRTVEDVAAVFGSAVLVGTLEPGASADFSLPPMGFAGEPISQQIYGFEDFGAEGYTEQRLRRQAVDGIAGAGVGVIPAGAIPATGTFGAEAIVLGWRDGSGGVEFSVDGHRVDRRTQTVEVVSGRPEYRPGPVSVPAARVTSLVTAVDGDTRAEGGSATIGVGSADFRLGLPLELVGYQPTKIEVLVGTDPTMLLAPEEFGVGVVFPPRYKLAARDLVSDSWVALGDLSTGVTFELDEPIRFLDATGQLVVRITATDEPDFQGDQATLYVSARFEGRLP